MEDVVLITINFFLRPLFWGFVALAIFLAVWYAYMNVRNIVRVVIGAAHFRDYYGPD